MLLFSPQTVKIVMLILEVSFIDLISYLNELFTVYLVFPLILFLGVYLTFSLKCVQLSKLKLGFFYLFQKAQDNAEGDISHYEAISSVLAGNLGTGNISGMAVALSTGGPGALVWMWVMVFLGSVIQYASCLLGVKHRCQNSKGEWVGGPMYYLKNGLGLKSLAVIFSIFVIFASFTAGDLVQINSIALPLSAFGISPLLVGVVIAILVAVVILGGIKKVAKVASAVVPIMAIIYLGAASFVLARHADHIFPAFLIMFKMAFSGSSLFGGILGFTVLKAMTTGFNRAVFATDAGTGLVPILQSGAKTRHPVVDGVVALTAPFIVMVLCTSTALVLIATGAYTHGDLHSTNMVVYAFQKGMGAFLGSSIANCSLALFGYTTILAWACCLQRAVGFLFGEKYNLPFQLMYIIIMPLGAVLHVNFVWILADISLSFMLLFNLIGIMGLSREVIRDSREFFALEEKI